MNGRKLQDRLYMSLGLSARHVGNSTDAFRPKSPFEPLDSANRFLRLPASFVSANGGYRRTNVYGDALWHGIFDASYTQPGDYLVQASTIFFVASQVPLSPVLCVMTNRRLSVLRPAMQVSAAGNSYGGYTATRSVPLMSGWPACVQSSSGAGSSVANLPTDQTIPYWKILLPAVSGVILASGDLLTDDLNRTAIIQSTELTELGWRISARMATT